MTKEIFTELHHLCEVLADWRLAGVVGFFGVMSVIRWSHWRIFSLTTDLLLRGPLLGRLEEKQIELKITFAKDFTHACAIEDDQEEMIDNEKWYVQYLRGSDFKLGNLKERNTWLWIDGVVGRWKDWKWMFYEAREIFGFEKKVGSWDKRK